MSQLTIESAVRDIRDFPKQGIVFKDISPILQSPALFKEVIDQLSDPFMAAPPDVIVAIDARGFLFGSAMAYRLGCGLTMVRKKGKLPGKTVSTSYDLEYGSNQVEIHQDALVAGSRALLVDDVLATGGTARAAADLIEMLGGQVMGIVFLLELCFLDGRRRLNGYDILSLIKVSG